MGKDVGPFSALVHRISHLYRYFMYGRLPSSKYQVGERVRIVGSQATWRHHGKEAVVTEILHRVGRDLGEVVTLYTYRIRLEDGQTLGEREHLLETLVHGGNDEGARRGPMEVGNRVRIGRDASNWNHRGREGRIVDVQPVWKPTTDIYAADTLVDYLSYTVQLDNGQKIDEQEGGLELVE